MGICAIVLCTFLAGGSGPRVKVEPLLWQDESQPATFFKRIHQIESNGNDLFLLNYQDAVIVQIKPDGTFVRQIGKKGPGPGEFGDFGPFSFAVHGESIWALHSHRKKAMYFEKGEFLMEIPLQSYQVTGYNDRHPFAFNADQLVMPVFPRTQKLAAVYDYGGNVLATFGNILPIDPEELQYNPAHNATIWTRDENRWYSLFRYRPILRIFDRDFKLIKDVQLTGPEITAYDEDYLAREKEPKVKLRPMFSDIEIHGGHVYTFCDGVMYQIDKRTGKVTERLWFYRIDEETGEPTPKTFFYDITFIDRGDLFLTAGSIFEHDGLYKTPFPFAKR